MLRTFVVDKVGKIARVMSLTIIKTKPGRLQAYESGLVTLSFFTWSMSKALYGNEILNANSTSGFSGGHWSDRGIHRDMT